MPDVPARLASVLSDRYRIDREIGAGGMATVYLAHDLKHDRQVAIKVLHPELAHALGPERFLREITFTAQFDHPYILPLLDSGVIDPPTDHGRRLLYYVMPYVAGESLRDRMKREKQLPLDDALQVTREVAEALGYAHARGVIHRDIKPENIMLSGGHARVADFGIARAIDAAGSASLTETGLAIGTPAYMSPEQSMAEREIDGRSDLYALGSVLYEMLAGEPPYTGPTAQAIIAKRMTNPAPSVRTVREAVPASVDHALARALAKAPADRFATAAEFAAALSAPHVAPVITPVSMPRAERPYRALGLAALVLAIVAGAIVQLRRPPTLPLDANLLAVAPFEVLDPSLELWREGMGDVLSRYLDGAGPLSTVSQTVVHRRWTGRPDRASAEALARRTGAGLVVFGQAVPKGGDSVLLRATVLRMAEGGAHEEIEVAGETGRLGALADSLGHGILDVLGRTRPIGATRLASLGAGSLPALKAFLRGEQLYRQGSWDSALVQYDRALTLDSGFALPNRRMAAILWFDPPTTHSYKRYEDYVRRAELLNRGLSARDSLLIAGLAAMARLAEGADDPTFFADSRNARAAFEAAVNRYPADPEAWYFLGEFRHDQEDAPWEESLVAFDRAIALDSFFAPSYEHTVQLAVRLGQPDLARRFANARLALNSDDAFAAGFRLDSALLDPRGAGAPELVHLLDTTTAWRTLWTAMFDLADWPDSAESAIRIAQIFPSPRRDYAGAPYWVRDSLVTRRVLASMLARRGHLREAYRAAPETSPSGFWSQFLNLALFGVVPAAVADASFRRLATTDSLRPPARQGLPWWHARGDSASLARFARRADSIGRVRAEPLAKLQLAYVADAARAYSALLRGDSTAALRGLEALPDSLCLLGSCFYQNLTRARLLNASGRDREAAQVIDQWLHTGGGGPWFVVGMLERGRVAERLKDREKAVQCYSFVLDSWRDADPELQPYVAEARDGLVRLTGEPRR